MLAHSSFVTIGIHPLANLARMALLTVASRSRGSSYGTERDRFWVPLLGFKELGARLPLNGAWAAWKADRGSVAWLPLTPAGVASGSLSQEFGRDAAQVAPHTKTCRVRSPGKWRNVRSNSRFFFSFVETGNPGLLPMARLPDRAMLSTQMLLRLVVCCGASRT